MTEIAKPASSIDISKRDLTLDLARVVCVLLVVVIHLLMVGTGFSSTGELIVSQPLTQQAWFAGATWVGQIMPLFFVVGGFASITAYRSNERKNKTGTDYVRNRVLRLAQPALPLFVFYFIVLGVALILNLDPELVDSVATGAGSPLWFLAAYTLCQAMVPVMVRLHRVAPVKTMVVLLVGAVVVDVLRYTTGVTEIGLFNLFFVWLFIQQVGFWYSDGWFDKPWWQLITLAVTAYALLGVLMIPGEYSLDMLTNLNPPTVPLILLGVAQAAVLRLLRPWLKKLMETKAARTVVFLLGMRLMTVYLWHLPVIILLSGASLLIPGAAPTPGSEAWWWTRPVMFILTLAAVFGLSFLVGRFEAVKDGGVTPPAVWVAVATVLAFIPSFCVMQWFMDFNLALVGVLLLPVAVLILGRWKSSVKQG